MSEEIKLCPICGHKLLRGWTGQGWALSCGSGNCLYRVNEKTNIEIAKALAYYREHKDRRCETCQSFDAIYEDDDDDDKESSPGDCNCLRIMTNKSFYCADWQPKCEVKR